MSLRIVKLSIPTSIRGSITKEEDVKSFLKELTDRFTSNVKVETTMLLTRLASMQYKGKDNIREYIMEKSNLVTRLRTLS